MNVAIKDKITLNDKGADANIPDLSDASKVEQAKVTLSWQSAVDLDLQAFIKQKDGRITGIFSEELPNGNYGDLNAFPFMKLSGDAGVGAEGGDNKEDLVIAKIDETVESIYICALNYTEAKNGNNVAFSQYDAKINFIFMANNEKSEFEVPLNSSEMGVGAVIAKIENGGITPTIQNSSEVMDLAKYVQDIPGADALTK